MTEIVTLRGAVSRQVYAAGSKSEHPAVLLSTADGRTLLLRRPGANPYADPELEALVGQAIEATGRIHRDVLLIESYRLL